MPINPQDELLRRRRGLGGFGGLLSPNFATPASRLGALGLYIPAASTTVGIRTLADQGAWGQSTPDTAGRPVGSPGVGETSAIPSQISPGIGEEAWRAPTGNIIPQTAVDQALGTGAPQVPRGQQGTEEVRGLANLVGSEPTEPPTTPASVGSPTPASGPGTISDMVSGQTPSPYQPTSPAPAAVSPTPSPTPAPAPTPSPAPFINVGNVGGTRGQPVRGRESHAGGTGAGYRAPGRRGAGGVLSGFRGRRGGLGGLISKIADFFGGFFK